MLELNREISKEIETIFNETTQSYIESILIWCERNNVEVETIGSILKKDPVLVEKLEHEASLNNLLKVKININHHIK